MLHVEGRRLPLTSPTQVLWPGADGEPATTKADLLAYYAAVAPALLAQLDHRPVTRIRRPRGGAAFVEKNVPAGAPDWLASVRVGDLVQPLLDGVAGLVWAAQLAVVELHTPQWRVDAAGRVCHPDRMILDLDPGPGTGLEECAALAHVLAGRVADEGLSAVPVTSGSKGLHLYVALPGTEDAAEVRGRAKRLAESVAQDHAGVTATMTTARRVGKVLIDWSQNSGSKTTATPYSPRIGTGGQARVAAPRRWDEVGPGLRQLGLAEVADRLATEGDLLAGPELGLRSGTGSGSGSGSGSR